MCAAARAVIDASRGARVLVASTDSAHSLGDALGVRLSRSPRAIAAAPVRAASAKTRRAGGRPLVVLAQRIQCVAHSPAPRALEAAALPTLSG